MAPQVLLDLEELKALLVLQVVEGRKDLKVSKAHKMPQVLLLVRVL